MILQGILWCIDSSDVAVESMYDVEKVKVAKSKEILRVYAMMLGVSL